METEDKILSLLTSFLGEWGKESGEWRSFNCPCCAEENMGDADGKYNLEVLVDADAPGGGGFHCWRCGESSDMKGRLAKLFRMYAPSDTADEFMRLIRDRRDSRKYEVSFGLDTFETRCVDEVTLPKDFKPVRKGDPASKEAYAYLMSRGLDDRIISEHHIGYVGGSSDERSMRNRIVFPSYDMYDALNYWTSRDYTGKNKQKSKNPKTSKHDIVFNEGLINWYEPVTLVEGPFDHVVTPNSIPLLGKVMTEDGAVFKALTERCRSTVRIFLDDDARKDAVRIYDALNRTRLSGRVLMVDTAESGHDASDIYREYGPRGILCTLCCAHEIKEYEMTFNI